ncbi:hypothetical protein LMG18102_03224 [Ralstonia mannitolilytica]|uniref:BRCT domain-containing protein n=1 Tax=Ralstonia mannitolilytica TaxID=105219 RepID=UPI0028F69116|nr:BRCT domain-containing protein [Ralstonia mannitolilytica]CAJ0700458.1 hypothetical protein LMG18102_03224 [Ralstonia mannitolilytica]
MQATLEFLYQNQKGERKEYSLTDWEEVGHYIEGICVRARAFRTFRKDRVIQYLYGCDSLLRNPRPSGPPPVRVANSAGMERAGERLEILFTGFPSAQRAELEQRAADAGLHVCKTVTQGLHFLCVGPNAGPSKIRKSRERGSYIVSYEQLLALLETGELPDEEPPVAARNDPT